MNDTPADEVDFGFRRVAREEKQGLVRGVFERVAGRYDLMNDLMSMGLHRLWKAEMITALKPRPGMRLLDVAGGTGDIAFRFLDRAGEGASAVVCDINPAMVSVGRDRAIDATRLEGIDWVVGNAEALPLPDRSVDAYTIAFGIRNVTDIQQALKEARRVLKPGGHFLCLEFGHVALPGLDKLYDLYSFQVLPRLGAAVAGDEESYRYLAESIRRFPKKDAFAAMMANAGLMQVRQRDLSGGIVNLHSGWRV
jgi:demethylmenaquinone methyltransferase/2-methoxy-6-polyprenyl-1,4-benzoquinol methylase